MLSQTGFVLLTSLILVGFGSVTARDEAPDEAPHQGSRQQNAATVVETFEKSYEDTKGYMRPLGDRGWEVRFRALRQLVLLGETSTPTLLEALDSPDSEVRILAAQALSLVGDPSARAALAKCLQKDLSASVRLYAADGLGILGASEHKDLLERVRAEDKNGDVRSHCGFALERPNKDVLGRVREDFGKYDVAQLSAVRLGEPAPNVTLESHDGKPVELASFRGKKAVVLVFIYGDT